MFERLSISIKFTLISLLLILLSLIAIGVAVITYDRHMAYKSHLQELDVLAKVIADRTVAALVFDDEVLAEENLLSLSARTSIIAACVFDEDGQLFARYIRNPELQVCQAPDNQDRMIISPAHILLSKSIVLDGSRVGELQLMSELIELKNRLNRIALFVFLIGMSVMLVVLLLSKGMVQKVSRPLVDLSALVKNITRNKNYGLRASKVAQDEVGVLVDAVNNMLETIEMQNRVLMDANKRLGDTVFERTTELQEAQESLLRKEHLATLGQLTGTVSHELRNPLGTIQASVDVLRGYLNDCPDEIDRPLQRIVRNIRRCEVIINELLDYSRGAPPNILSSDVMPWLKGIVDSYPGHGRVHFDSEMDESMVADMDAERMRRAVINVLDNAMQACMERESSGPDDHNCFITVVLTCSAGCIRIAIKDTGTGMSELVMQKVFEPLFSTKAFGVGLGLAIVKQILEQHNGGVEIESNIGVGTVTTLWFPATSTVP